MRETVLVGESELSASKRELRSKLITGRKQLSGTERADASGMLCAQLAGCQEIAAARVVACYFAVGTEPNVTELIERVRGAGKTVLLPVLLEDNDLDWALHDGALRTGRRGLREPAGPRQGPGAIADADVVVVPGLAVDRVGRRLGRGGGSYDRALLRVSPAAWTVTPLYRGELLDELPAEAHDQRVHAAATPDGVLRVGDLR